MTYLIIGNCGVGKTWLMRRLIEHFNLKDLGRLSKIDYITNGKVFILGKYDGSVFEGSDRLSMAVANDFEGLKSFLSGKIIICEGDRFTNRRFIETFDPVVIKIEGDGEWGRKLRKSKQSSRHLKSIETRVNNIDSDYQFENNESALDWIKKRIQNEC